ncbi:MAG: SIMPL domain-containing protein [Candidatus Nomurabacteria bacterium]
MDQGKCKLCNMMGDEKCVCKKRIVFVMVIVVLFLAIYFGIVSAVKIYGDYTSPRALTITGTGEVYAVPDISTISFTARSSNESNDTQKLQSDIKVSVDNVVSKLKVLGIEDKDIKTTDYSVNPKYGSQACPGISSSIYPPIPCSTSKVVGYEASESVNIKVRDTANVGKVLAALADAKITEISGPNLEVDDINKIKDEARDKAILDAKEKAKSLSKSLGIEIEKIISYSDDSSNQGYSPMVYKSSMSDSVGVSAPNASIMSGEQKITSNISIVYQIR